MNPLIYSSITLIGAAALGSAAETLLYAPGLPDSGYQMRSGWNDKWVDGHFRYNIHGAVWTMMLGENSGSYWANHRVYLHALGYVFISRSYYDYVTFWGQQGPGAPPSYLICRSLYLNGAHHVNAKAGFMYRNFVRGNTASSGICGVVADCIKSRPKLIKFEFDQLPADPKDPTSTVTINWTWHHQ